MEIDFDLTLIVAIEIIPTQKRSQKRFHFTMFVLQWEILTASGNFLL